jgi:hypothetical protein
MNNRTSSRTDLCSGLLSDEDDVTSCIVERNIGDKQPVARETVQTIKKWGADE